MYAMDLIDGRTLAHAARLEDLRLCPLGLWGLESLKGFSGLLLALTHSLPRSPARHPLLPSLSARAKRCRNGARACIGFGVRAYV